MKLPQFRGKPVPWVTRWSGEVVSSRYEYRAKINANTLRLSYGEGLDFHDPQGVLWQREGIGRNGTPDWSAVSSYRQRDAMLHRKCQVCGSKIEGRSIDWLMPLGGTEQLDEDVTITQQPPTCTPCIPLALSLCPHLKATGYVVMRVLDYTVWGVQGHVVTDYNGSLGAFQGAISYDTTQYGGNFSLGQVMAQQQIVQLGEHVVIDGRVGEA